MMVSSVYRALWRHRLFMVVITGVVVVVASAFTARQPKLYTASSLVRVQQQVRDAQDVFGALQTGERLARTYERIAETESVRALVRARLRGSVPADAVVVDAKQLSNLELLQIGVTNRDPEVAATVANAVPAALAAFVKTTDTDGERITVVERASPPATPSSPNMRLNLALAFLLGLILSGGLALAKETFSDRIEGAEELERSTGHPVIATIPDLKFTPLQSSLPAEEPQRQLGELDTTTAARPTAGSLPHG
jgi:capsular polysaccharide biosynthesis protein